MQERIYVIGDVHGCYNTLMALVNKLPANAKLCFVGDLIDRGLDSSRVIQFIKSNKYDCVLGNHELMFIDGVENYLEEEYEDLDYDTTSWLNRCGGESTIASYKENYALLRNHLKFIKELPLYIEYKNIKTKDNRYLVVSHSHIANAWEYRNSPKNSIDYESFETNILFARNKDFDNKEIYNVFGHTPTRTPLINEYKANIDLGCVYKPKNENFGKLCALEFPSLKVITQEYIG